MTTTRRRGIVSQTLLLLPPPLLLPLPPLQASMPAPPLLTLIKQWQQWWQHGVAACAVAVAADSRMPSLTPAFFCFLLNVCYTWHRIPCFMGPSIWNSGQIPESVEDSETNYSCPGIIYTSQDEEDDHDE
jgi:hypothetical protein